MDWVRGNAIPARYARTTQTTISLLARAQPDPGRAYSYWSARAPAPGAPSWLDEDLIYGVSAQAAPEASQTALL